MPWNWQLPAWPHFTYNEKKIAEKEREFLLKVGSSSAFLKSIKKSDFTQFVVEILSVEGVESSKIEGEILDRMSLQSSIQKHFGLNPKKMKSTPKEAGMAEVLHETFETFDKPLNHKMLFKWHQKLFGNHSHLTDLGRYRTFKEPMQIVSNRNHRVFFEAPPSHRVPKEMTAFIKWFNSKKASESILGRAALAHVYFESIHPFEDGNGRIGRVLVEKVLSQSLQRPLLIAVSKTLERRKKEYYQALEKCNRTLEVDPWVEFFSEIILEAQEESLSLLSFLIEKSKLLTRLSGQINPRQEKVIVRILKEGLNGFQGGLSAENYISITKASRATATRDLTDLVEKGIFHKTGELKHTRYWLKLPSTNYYVD